jgi:hypothetical protein
MVIDGHPCLPAGGRQKPDKFQFYPQNITNARGRNERTMKRMKRQCETYLKAAYEATGNPKPETHCSLP